MRVKRLEIQGFKSFKDKTVIHFDHGITGIVGPNGCGKSNIVDAFFWVMGEQSYKHMRGSGSEDLIFNGSSKYSPLGIAEATLVMETDAVDTDESLAGPDALAGASSIPIHLRSKEVSVTRRLYRGGEGEYFINGVSARLKDIQELFMDTGVGAKGYSVIEQGQIGKIVNAKPEDRRLLIEEAAGIAKYKARKKESLRKMEATQSNLSRLNDVIAEIERNLNSLERQAQKARQYKNFKEELLDKEMTWGRRKTLVLRQRLEAISKERDALEQELTGLRAELQTAENEIEVDRIDQTTHTNLAEELQAQIQHFASELATDRSALELSRRRKEDLSAQKQALETEQSELVTSITAEREKLAHYEDEVRAADAGFQDSSLRAQQMNDAVRSNREQTETARRTLDQSKRELMNGITQASDLTSRAASLLSKMESAQAQAERILQQTQAQEEKVADAKSEAATATETLEKIRATRENLAVEKCEQLTSLHSHEQDLRNAEKSRDESLKNTTQLKSRLESLIELASVYEGFGDGPRAALDWARSNGVSNKLFALADVYDVEAGFETAIEGWLESRLQGLIAEDSTTAVNALAEVSKDKLGRVEIHVASPVFTGKLASVDAVRDALSQAGFNVLGELSQFARCGNQLGARAQEIAQRLVEGVLVVESFEPLSAFLDDQSFVHLAGRSIVSLDGRSLDSYGVLRGGHTEADSTASAVRRKRAIQDLEVNVAAAETEFAGVEVTAIAAKQALDLARTRLQALDSDIQVCEVEKASFERDIHGLNRAALSAEEQLEEAKLELEQAKSVSENAIRERAEIETRVSEIVSIRAALEVQIESQDVGLATTESSLRTQETELQTLKVNEASMRERASSLKREFETGSRVITDRERRVHEIARTLERALKEHEEFDGGESNLETKIEEMTAQLSAKRAELAQIKDLFEQSGAKLSSALDRIKHLHKVGDEKTTASNHLSLEVEKVSSDLNHLIQNLEEKYGPGCLERPVTSPIQEEMNEPVVTAEMSAEEEILLGEDVERLRERIRRLGEVNVMAIDEYEELKKRFDYLLTERSDLNHSLKNLEDAIEHINKTSEERFKKAFEAIADRFERLFPIIFGGGQAKLSLVYPEGSTEILDAGVDILAQPPGKKIVNISLLSGGEKALTAVSLIFAIFMVKPSPFCVLDEVDAPLDDANIGKFNALLREMSAKSQFILITHNKKTMELNDTLYGVTMEEPGVSKMVSIEMH